MSYIAIRTRCHPFVMCGWLSRCRYFMDGEFVRRPWLIGTLTCGALATAFAVYNVSQSIAQLHTFAASAATAAQNAPRPLESASSALPTVSMPAPVERGAVAPNAAELAQGAPLPSADAVPVPHPGYRLPERRSGFDANALQAAIEAEPSIGELVNDPDPKVRAAILAFFEND